MPGADQEIIKSCGERKGKRRKIEKEDPYRLRSDS